MLKTIPPIFPTGLVALPPSPDTDDDSVFYTTVARQMGKSRLSLPQGELAFTARKEAIASFERDGPTVPPTGVNLVYQIAWLITQNRLMENAK